MFTSHFLLITLTRLGMKDANCCRFSSRILSHSPAAQESVVAVVCCPAKTSAGCSEKDIALMVTYCMFL